MKLFRKHQDGIMIIGCGRLGAKLADQFSDQGKSVVILDQNPDAFRKLSTTFGGLSITGDARSYDTLKEAGIGECSDVICVTNRDNANVMIAQIAKHVFGIPRVTARLYDQDLQFLYSQMGIDSFCPASLSTSYIIDHLNSGLQEDKQ